MIARREFIAALGGAAAWPLAARAQQAGAIPRVGVLLGIANDEEGQSRVKAFSAAMQVLGWIEGRNVQFEYRWTGGQPEQIRTGATELVAMQPDVLLSTSAPCLVALRNETTTIPIVFVLASDPVGMGLVESLARPGRNVTGFTPFEPSLGGKWVELLKDIAPLVTRAAILFNPNTAPNAHLFLQSAQSAAASFGMIIMPTTVREHGQVERAIAEVAQQPGGVLILLPDPFLTNARGLIAASAVRHRLPLIGPFRYFAASGSLVSYGINPVREHERAASYVDRILRGEKAANLPIQAPTKYDLVINLKTAKALGIEVPATLLARADEVIE